MEVLQTSALPLGHVAAQLREIACRSAGRLRNSRERAMGFEPTTFSLARRRSTTELHPRCKLQSMLLLYELVPLETLAGAAGLEPTTYGFGDRCSAKLSYAPIAKKVAGAGFEPATFGL